MVNKYTLSIVICTRNRPYDLKKCIKSISHQQRVELNKDIEVIIIDDGSLSDAIINECKSLLKRFKFRYIKKEEPGLFLSRINAISMVTSNIILFLDDDIELENNYLEILMTTYNVSPDIVGMCGVDQFLRKPGFFAWLYNTIFLLKSNQPGKLSLTGYGVSMKYWKDCQDCFETQFLSGCNMSFRKDILTDLKLEPVDWLSSYSLGEDMYISYLVSLKGKIIVNPKLSLKHYQSKITRDRLDVLAYSEVVNHRYLLNVRKAKKWQCILQVWTTIGLLTKSILTLNFNKTKGYIKGMEFILNWEKAYQR